jgi:hypothetical protein
MGLPGLVFGTSPGVSGARRDLTNAVRLSLNFSEKHKPDLIGRQGVFDRKSYPSRFFCAGIEAHGVTFPLLLPSNPID